MSLFTAQYQAVDLLLFTDGGTAQTLFLLMKYPMALVCCFWRGSTSAKVVITAVLLPVMEGLGLSTRPPT